MKGQRPKRKVVLILVEGQSEINALQPVLSAFYDSIDENIEVFFPTIVEDECDVRGDITSKKGISPDVIEGCINKLFLKDFFDVEKLYPKDISEIIQIVDLDGAYIADDKVLYGENPLGENKPFYGDDTIITTDVDNIIERNGRKRENLNYLSSISTLTVKSKKPRYSVYFFSSNLDHFLHGDANMKSRDKVLKADEYASRYESDPSKLVSDIKAKPGTLVDKSYEESWEYIKSGNRSLEPHTNINILFDRLMEEPEE